MSQAPRPSKVTVPQHCNPLAKVVFAEMQRQGVTYFEMELRSGILMSTFKAWRAEKNPGLLSLSACLQSLGWSLVAVPNLDTLSPEARQAIEDAGQHFRTDEETFGTAILAAAEFPGYARTRLPVVCAKSGRRIGGPNTAQADRLAA